MSDTGDASQYLLIIHFCYLCLCDWWTETVNQLNCLSCHGCNYELDFCVIAISYNNNLCSILKLNIYATVLNSSF